EQRKNTLRSFQNKSVFSILAVQAKRLKLLLIMLARNIELAVKAHIHQKHTNYDQLLSNGWERTEARSAVTEKLSQILREWSRK
ncbi:MAG: DUF2293 domain-containing protein, partial [Methylobacter sp.]|nr:DUF2293 domain-containing protein [Methylobacter sp.]